ncbi:lysophospholipid acyltransferase family protein [Thermodesulfobacteriota bacterium]
MKNRFLNQYILPYVGLLFVKIISVTYRFKIVNPEVEQNVLEKGQVPIYAAWHQRLFAGIAPLAKRKPISIMISQSRDGEYIARIIDMLGWRPVRGSSSRGGREALKEIISLTRQGYRIVHIVDGPQGPPGVIKPGLIKIAQHSGMPILFGTTSAEKKWVCNSWDRFIVPKPFSRVIIRFGDEIHIPRNLGKVDFEKKRSAVEKALKQFIEETDRMWTDPEIIQQVFGNSPGFLTRSK